MELSRHPLTVAVILSICFGLTSCCFLGFIGSCKNGTDYCCLQYERGEALATYCNNHSGAVGIYMASLASDSERSMWFDSFQHFYVRIGNCASPACIEDSLRAATGLAAFISDYAREHDDAEAVLVAHPEMSLIPAEKARLIRCGFSDAIERTKANLQQE